MERSTPAEFETDEASGLIQRIRRGEPSAWRQLVDQYEGRLLSHNQISGAILARFTQLRSGFDKRSQR